MKFITYILAFMVIFLSTKSGNDTVLSDLESQKPCCTLTVTANQEDSNSEQEHSNDERCNPFQACCSFILVSLSAPFSPLVHVEISTTTIFTYQTHFSSSFISDFWQPPQWV